MSGKINQNMDFMDVVLTMAEGNPEAIAVVIELFSIPTGPSDILMLDNMDIRGERLYMLHNDCCYRNPKKFKRTLAMLRAGVFTEEQIQDNLGLCYALPFIDDTIEIEGVPPYGEDFDPTHPKWNEWVKAQQESFESRSATV